MATGPAAEVKAGLDEPPLSAEAMLRAEFAHVLGDVSWSDQGQSFGARLRQLNESEPNQRPSALCLSGGGIRSATFCLGVLQWLATQRRLDDFHYLSTVSGGGYIGSWLVNGLCQASRASAEESEAEANRLVREAQSRMAAQRAERPALNPSLRDVAKDSDALAEARVAADAIRKQAAEHAAAATGDWLARVGQSAGTVGAAASSGASRTVGDRTDPVAPLRAFSNYLSPTGGMSGDAFSLAAIFIRNLLLNALVWLPLLAAFVSVPRLYIATLGFEVQPTSFNPVLAVATVVLSLVVIIVGVVYIVADLPGTRGTVAVPTSATSATSLKPAADGAPRGPNDWFFWFCFLPIAIAAVLLSAGGSWLAPLRHSPWWAFALVGAGAHLLGVFAGIPVRTLRGNSPRSRSARGAISVVIVGAVGGALASLALSQLGPDPMIDAVSERQRLLYATFAVPAMTGAFWLAMALYAGLMGRLTDEQDREWWARATAAWLKFSILWLAAFALTVWLPLPLLDRLGDTGSAAVQFGVGSGVLGVLTSLVGYWSKNGGDLKRRAQTVLRVTRLKLLDAMAGLVVLSLLLALSMGWSAALDRCHDWTWTSVVCRADLHRQNEFLREQTQLRSEYERHASSSRNAPPGAPFTLEGSESGMSGPGSSVAAQTYRHVLAAADWRMLLAACMVLFLFAAMLAQTMGVNVFSLHGMYGNRLVRAYLGSGRATRHPHWFTGFDPADNPQLADMAAPLRKGRLPRLFPVINIALNAVRPSPAHLDWQQRKAAPFIATPLHCGAAPVGFRSTSLYAGGMSLGRAMTISGAAASPNMGYHSSALVTFVMTLFNVRLGWWSPNPGRASGTQWTDDQPRLGLRVAWDEARGSTGVEDPFVYLSDGGHFENLGIYEMVRRRCRRIVAVDATCDGKFKWTDLLEAVRKVRVDFGIPIELPSVLPGPGRETANTRFLEAKIRYSARDGSPEECDGTLIVLKPRLIRDEDPPELAAYADASAPEGSTPDDPSRFPHQSTADQFFNEQQFESYRLLGYCTAEHALGKRRPVAPPWRRVKRPAAASAAVTAAVQSADSERAKDRESSGAGASGLAGLAGAAGVGNIVQQIGAGTALAAALTVGGTLGIAGSVALAPTELTLSDTDRALIREGMQLRLENSDLKLSGEDRDLLREGVRLKMDGAALDASASRLVKAGDALNVAATHLSTLTIAAASAPRSGSIDPQLLLAIQGLRGDINQLRDRIRATGQSGGTSAEQPDLTTSVVLLQQTLKKLEEKLPNDQKLATALKELKDAVDRISPSRNVRGQDGSGR